MQTTILTYNQIELACAKWASSQPDVRAILIFGSRARTEHPASEWSDLDLMVILNEPSVLTARTDWLMSIGEVQFTAREAVLRDDWIPLVVIFTGNLKVDIVFTVTPESCSRVSELTEVLAASPYPYVFSDGFKVLYDRYPSNSLLTLSTNQGYSPSMPSQDQFVNAINLFWVHAIHTATLIWRGEQWRTYHQLQVELKDRLLTFLEWQARLCFGTEHKIWPRGCYLEDWADPRLVAELPGCFTVSSSGGAWSALRVTCNLFHRLGVEIAERLGFTYPEASEVCSREWINSVDSSHLL